MTIIINCIKKIGYFTQVSFFGTLELSTGREPALETQLAFAIRELAFISSRFFIFEFKLFIISYYIIVIMSCLNIDFFSLN